MSKYLDQVNFQFLFNKKSDFSILYKHGASTINFVGTGFQPTSFNSLLDELNHLQDCDKWYIDIHSTKKKQDGLLQVFESDGGLHDKKEMFCTLVLDEFAFGRLEANLVNNGRDFLEKLIIQISVDKSQIKKLKKESKGFSHSLKVVESSVHFKTNRDDDYDDE